MSVQVRLRPTSSVSSALSAVHLGPNPDGEYTHTRIREKDAPIPSVLYRLTARPRTNGPAVRRMGRLDDAASNRTQKEQTDDQSDHARRDHEPAEPVQIYVHSEIAHSGFSDGRPFPIRGGPWRAKEDRFRLQSPSVRTGESPVRLLMNRNGSVRESPGVFCSSS